MDPLMMMLKQQARKMSLTCGECRPYKKANCFIGKIEGSCPCLYKLLKMISNDHLFSFQLQLVVFKSQQGGG
jgi:hypothetical protein